MYLTRKTIIQMAILILVTLVAGAVMVFNFIGLPAMLFGTGQYRVTLQIPEAGGLYPRGNVTWRGTEVGRVAHVRLTDKGVEAELAMNSRFKIPADLDAEINSVSAVGEQYVALTPRNANQPYLKDGDVIPASRTFIPPDVNSVLDATNRGLQAIPHDNLKTVVDEAYTAIGGLGPELARFVKGSTGLAIDARKNLGELTALIDQSAPVLNSQTDTAGAIQAWAAHLDTITGQLKQQDQAVAGVLQKGAPAADEVRALFDRLQPTLPILLANLVGLGEVAVTYQPNLEQLLVLLPQGAAVTSAIGVANRHTRQDYRGAFLSFNLNLNLPPPCVTGFLPPSRSGCPLRWMPPTGHPAICTAGFRRIRASMCAARATSPAPRCPANAPPPSSSARAARSTSRSTMASAGRATPTPPCRVRSCPICRRGRHLRKPPAGGSGAAADSRR